MKPVTSLYLAIIVLALTIPSGAAENPGPGRLLFDSSVTTGTDNWSFADPAAWKTGMEEENGLVLRLEGASAYQPKVRSPLNIAWLAEPQPSSFILEVEAKSTSREYPHRDLCFFFGRRSDTEFYYVHIATASDPHANSIFLVDSADRISIAGKRTDGTKWTDGKFHKVRIERNSVSGRILVFFDDMRTPIMEASDTTFSTGNIGLGSFDDVGEFRNLKIYELPE